MTAEHDYGFFIAAFGVDGELEGVARSAFGNLSAKWLDLCAQFLAHYGEVFTAPWSGKLAHIQTRFTSSQGTALATFDINNRPAVSMALVSGVDLPAESGVLKMFVDSLRQVEFVAACASSPEPCARVLALSERPLVFVVPWPDEHITEQDHDLVRELATHTAAAFFLREGTARGRAS